MKHFDRADYEALPLALTGALIGAVRYFVVLPLVDQFHTFIDNHSVFSFQLGYGC